MSTNRLVPAYGLYYLDSRPTLLRCAELQYFRVAPEQWESSVSRLRDAGCNAIGSYIPWSWHEPAPGAHDFDGATDPQRGLARFLEAVQRAGLVFMARPGPFIYAEYRGFGFPAWLPEAIPEALARHCNGRPALHGHDQTYSLLHPAFLARVEAWYGAAAGALRPYLNQPVVSWQLDNETGITFAGTVGRLDFNADTVARYRAFLRDKYEAEPSLAREWRRAVPPFDGVLPPVDARSAGELHDWQEFLESWVGAYLDRLRQMLHQQGFDVPLMVNEPADYVSPAGPRAKVGTGALYGYDSYSKATATSRTADFPFAGSYHAARFQQFARDEQPLSCWELGAGWWDRRARVSTAATLQALAGGIARGLKAYNLYVAQDGRDVNGDEYSFGALLNAAGNPTARYHAVAALQRWIAAHEEELTASAEVRDSIAVLDYQPYARFLPEDFLPGGLPDPHHYFARRGLAGLHAILATAGYNPVFVDLDAVSDEDLGEFAAAVFPSRGFLDLHTYGKLVVFAIRGGALVTLPVPVTRDRDGTRFKTEVLWPFRPLRVRRLDRVRLLWHLVSRWALPQLAWRRRRLAGELPGARHLASLFDPVLAGQAAPLRGAGLTANDGTTIRGDYVVTEFVDAPPKREARETLLRYGGLVAGYRVQARSGTSTLLGTVLGGAYATSRYYALRPDERRSLRRFTVGLFEDVAPRQIVPDDDLEVEAVARLSPDGGCLLFVINRLGAQRGTIRFPQPQALNLGAVVHAQVEYSAFGSIADADGDGVSLRLVPDDVLVVRLT